jgi:hypothetical protein
VYLFVRILTSHIFQEQSELVLIDRARAISIELAEYPLDLGELCRVDAECLAQFVKV